jgi:drug/metabolite transporter (DMT)-like permease
MQKRYLKKYSPIELTGYSIWIGTFLMVFFINKPFLAVLKAPLSQTLTVIYLGIFPGAIAFLLVGLALKKYQVSKFSSYLFLIPFITIFIARIVIHEVITLAALTGGVFVITGILVKNAVFKAGKSSPMPGTTTQKP